MGGVGSNDLNRFQIWMVQKHSKFSKFDRPKMNLSELQKFGIKYGFEYLKKMSSVLHINFFRFRRDFA
jgi:hypothetical protein